MATPSVLIIEDNPHISYLLSELVTEEQRARATTAATGSEGLERARSDQPDIILCDYQLPDITGSDILVELKGDEATQSIPVIMVTAYGNAQLRDECLAAGAEAIILKPFTPERLLEAIRDALGDSSKDWLLSDLFAL